MDFVTFNITEGAFWVLSGIVIIIVAFKTTRVPPVTLYRLGTSLMLLGISDFIEASIDSSFFLPENYWLFAIKIVVFVALVIFLYKTFKALLR